LQLKAHIGKADGVFTEGSADSLLSGNAGHDSMRPTLEQKEKEVLPALNAALAKETNRDIVSGALIALAKIGEQPEAAMTQFKKFLNNGDQEVSETAALAFGILASVEGVPILRDLFEDKDAGRKLVGKNEVPFRTRTFACYGLGLTATRSTDADLRREIQGYLITFLKASKRQDTRDLRVAAVISLGLIPDTDRKGVKALEEFFEENRKKEDVICAHVPNAISRLLRTAALEERKVYCDKILADLEEKSKGKDTYIRQSMAQALGLLTKADDPHAKKTFEVLQEKIEKELSKNKQLAYFGMIALGQISGSGDPNNAIDKYLLDKAMAEGGVVMTRAWAALALGVAAFDQLNATTPKKLEDSYGARLTEKMMSIKDGEQRAAYAIALGLMRYTPAATAIKKSLFEDIKDDTWRGYFATGLGLMNEKTAIDGIKKAVTQSTRRPEFLREAAISLGLLGDKKVLDDLVNILKDKDNKTVAVQAAVATALGYVGDRRAIKPLCTVLADEKKELSSESRAFAAVALGIVCDKEEYPWNFKISTDLNYTAAVETLNDQGSQTGLLNLL
jgi:HEAT repeat protein